MNGLRQQKLPFSKKKLRLRVILSYIFDYAIIILLIVAFTIIDRVTPFRQHFSLQNYTLQYPYAVHERVPVPLLVFLVVVIPAGVIVVYTLVIDGLFSHHKHAAVPGSGRRALFERYRFKDRLWELNCGILGLLLSVGFAYTVTGALKNAIGKPRPDLIDRCQPRPGSVDRLVYGLSNYTICTQTDMAILNDGYKSFPSGHSSTSFAGLGYLSLYLAAKLHVLDSKGEVWKAFVVLVPSLGAALIAGTRIMDARHHPFDVLSGSLMGFLIAWAAYRQYFPPVSETWRKGRAYPIRSWGAEPLPPSERLDEGVEPLRSAPAPIADEEQPKVAGYTTATGTDTGDDRNGDVFRQQISASQRRLAEQDAVYNGAHSSYSASQPPALHPTNPFSSGSRSRPHDDYWVSSSEDEDNGFELQQQYAMSDPQGHAGRGGAYGPMAGSFAVEDTSYRPRVPVHVQAPTQAHTGQGQQAAEVAAGDENGGAQLGDIGAQRFRVPQDDRRFSFERA